MIFNLNLKILRQTLFQTIRIQSSFQWDKRGFRQTKITRLRLWIKRTQLTHLSLTQLTLRLTETIFCLAKSKIKTQCSLTKQDRELSPQSLLLEVKYQTSQLSRWKRISIQAKLVSRRILRACSQDQLTKQWAKHSCNTSRNKVWVPTYLSCS